MIITCEYCHGKISTERNISGTCPHCGASYATNIKYIEYQKEYEKLKNFAQEETAAGHNNESQWTLVLRFLKLLLKISFWFLAISCIVVVIAMIFFAAKQS